MILFSSEWMKFNKTKFENSSILFYSNEGDSKLSLLRGQCRQPADFLFAMRLETNAVTFLALLKTFLVFGSLT